MPAYGPLVDDGDSMEPEVVVVLVRVDSTTRLAAAPMKLATENKRLREQLGRRKRKKPEPASGATVIPLAVGSKSCTSERAS